MAMIKLIFESTLSRIIGSIACCSAMLSLAEAQPRLSEERLSEYFVEYIDISKGLSNNYVSKIVEDEFGMIWMACEGGVNRYEGDKFKILRPDERYAENLLNENIETLFVDSKNFVWVGTKSGGVSRYNQAKDQFVNFNEAIRQDGNVPTIRITDIAEDKEGNIWIATWKQGLYKLSANDYLLEDSFLSGRIVQGIEVDDFGNVWATSNNMLHKYDPSESRMINLDVPIGAGTALHYDQFSKKLLIGSYEGLFSFDIGDYSIEEFEQSKALDFEGINTINVDQKGRIWVGSWSQGLHLSSPDRKDFKKISLVPPGQNNTNFETVLDIHIDDGGQIWIGTGWGGVVRLSPRKSISYIANAFDNDTNLPDNNIQAVTKDSNGTLWCGTWSGGVGYSRDGKKFKHLPGSENYKISAFLQLGDTMLVGTSNGLLSYDVNNLSQGPIRKSFVRRKIKDLFLDREHRLWIGTQQNGLWLFDYQKDKKLNRGEKFQTKNNTLQSDRISKVVEDQQGKIWVGTYNGLYVYNSEDSTFTRKDNTVSEKLPSVIVLTLLPADSNKLWIGMPGGLLKTTTANDGLALLKNFNIDKGLRNDYITGVTYDNQGNIWLSNTSGIATIQNDSDAIINVTGSREYAYAMNINSYFNDGNKIYFGSSNGLFIFDPLQVDLLESAPNLIFNNLKVDNKEVNVDDEINGRVVLEKAMPFTDELKITHKESIVSVGFVPANFQDKANLSYYYRVLGLQENWIDNGSTSEINFIGLDAGNYVLEVKSTRDKVHFSEVSTMKISVLPPPWLSNLAYAIYLILAIAILVLINKFFVNRTKLNAKLAMAKLTTEKEHELNEAKLRFFTNISHELRTPLTLILSPITEILGNPKLKPGLRERLTYVEQNAQRLLDLINQLLDFRKADQGELTLKVATGNFAKFAKEVFLSFKGYADTEGVVYDFDSSSEAIELTYDRDKMEILLCNLLSNAFKFTSPKGRITLSLEEDEENCLITVKDTGKGISKEAQEKIFNRFFQIQDSESAQVIGSGIGLSLSQKIAELHNGTIEVNSGVGKGSTFTVKIPKGIEHFEESTFISDFKFSEDISVYGEIEPELAPNIEDEVEIETFEEGPVKLLIVDDNKDILSYLKTLFEENGYKIETATNGLEGRNVAFELVPDLIISDVMMPEMDGIELCGVLKNDIRTSHIPIILLTARTSTVYEVDGLETGADDYVRKPFDSEVIKSRVASQLENRQKVRSYLVNQVRFESNKTIKPINREEKFIQEVSDLVEKSILDETFSIDNLADDLCMSQSTLYRKIKSLTGMSIVGFIRSIRLRKATEILITEDIKLSAVAYSVGFNDYKYFKKSFTQQYGFSPKEYRENAIQEA